MKTIFENDSDFICNIQAPCFQVLSQEETELVSASKTQVLFRKGDTLTKQGTFSSYVLFIIDGLVKQYIEGDNNKNFNLRIIKPGEFIGLSSVFSKNLISYSSVSLTDSRAFLIEKETIEKVVKQNGTFGFNIIKRSYDQNINLFETMGNVLFKQMNGRLADTLLYINDLKTDNPDIFQLLSRKDIADFAGISTESTVKILKTLEKEAIISLVEKDILIIDKNRLEKISKNG
jgi:CRP/FNR family transcriptional regulator